MPTTCAYSNTRLGLSYINSSLVPVPNSKLQPTTNVKTSVIISNQDGVHALRVIVYLALSPIDSGTG